MMYSRMRKGYFLRDTPKIIVYNSDNHVVQLFKE